MEKNTTNKVFEINHFCVTAWKKKEKSVTGNENDKSIKSYSAPLSTEQQFESSSIIRRFVTQVNSGQFSTFSYSWASLVPLPLFFYDFLSFHYQAQQQQS